jgi:DNA-binding XRE family transcriptional regulator
MSAGHMEINGRRYMIVDEAEYSRLATGSAGALPVREEDLPPFPNADADGNVPAMEYARASLARKIIIERSARGWTQTELARRAGVRVETINRLENARHTADLATAKKIQNALDAHRPATGTRRRTATNGTTPKRAGGIGAHSPAKSSGHKALTSASS